MKEYTKPESLDQDRVSEPVFTSNYEDIIVGQDLWALRGSIWSFAKIESIRVPIEGKTPRFTVKRYSDGMSFITNNVVSLENFQKSCPYVKTDYWQ